MPCSLPKEGSHRALAAFGQPHGKPKGAELTITMEKPALSLVYHLSKQKVSAAQPLKGKLQKNQDTT